MRKESMDLWAFKVKYFKPEETEDDGENAWTTGTARAMREAVNTCFIISLCGAD
jgi:hypothetical protein